MSQREEADAALRKNQAQFQSIMHQAPMMVSLKDREGRYTFVNEAFQKFTGRGEQRARQDCGRSQQQGTRGFHRGGGSCRHGRPARGPARGHQPARAWLTHDAAHEVSGVRRAQEVSGVGTVMTDITEQKQASCSWLRPSGSNRSASSPAASRTTSTTCSPRSCSTPMSSPAARRQAAPARRGVRMRRRARRRPDAAAAGVRAAADAGAAADRRQRTARAAWSR